MSWQLSLILYFINIIRWRNTPELGFAFRTATGIKMISVLRESGRGAGLQVGDRVLKINGKSFDTITEFRSALKRDPGQNNTYLVEREGRQFEATIINQPLGFKIAFIRSGFPYLVGLIYVLIPILVFFMKPHHRASWVFFLWSSIFGLYLSFLIKIDEFRPYWLSTIHMFLYTFTPAVFVHMAMSFPEERELIQKRPLTQLIAYIPSAIIFASMRAITPEMWNLPKIWRIVAVAYMVLALLIYLVSCLQLLVTSRSEIVKVRPK